MSEVDDRDRHDLQQLRRMKPAGGVAAEWEQPPDDLWQRIAVAAGVEQQTGASAAAMHGTPAAERTGDAADDKVVSLAEHRRRRWTLPLSLAAATVLVGVIATVLLTRGGDGDEVVAEVRLDRLAGNGSGTAQMVDHDGHMQLHLHTSDLDAGDGYLEVWLIDPTVSKLVSLGPLRDDGVYDLPAGVDPLAFPIVDVSAEPVDGNPAHSGDSLLRGQLPFDSA